MLVLVLACNTDSNNPKPEETDYTDVLTNQIDNVIIPSMTNYQSEMEDLLSKVEAFNGSINQNNFYILCSLHLLRKAEDLG